MDPYRRPITSLILLVQLWLQEHLLQLSQKVPSEMSGVYSLNFGEYRR